MRTVVHEQVASAELALPPSVQEALGELVNAAKDGLLALSVGVGLGVLAEMMELEVEEVVGPKGERNPGRTAVRHGHENGESRSAGGVSVCNAHVRGPLTASTRSRSSGRCIRGVPDAVLLT